MKAAAPLPFGTQVSSSPAGRQHVSERAVAWAVLALLCVIVGLVLDQLDLNAFELFQWAIDQIEDAIRNSAHVLKQIGRYFLIGAVVVVPVWIILRVLRLGSGR